MHQFRRTDEGFTREHSLYDYGETAAGGKVYREHVIDSIEEQPEDAPEPENRPRPKR